mmetsp:Transcript_51340/g.109161  ORF Transcript_51340/g.109161 Transcript_51340/m.109161 type:complete len:303 (+) Transcript_51340:1001-1909(+)
MVGASLDHAPQRSSESAVAIISSRRSFAAILASSISSAAGRLLRSSEGGGSGHLGRPLEGLGVVGYREGSFRAAAASSGPPAGFCRNLLCLQRTWHLRLGGRTAGQSLHREALLLGPAAMPAHLGPGEVLSPVRRGLGSRGADFETALGPCSDQASRPAEGPRPSACLENPSDRRRGAFGVDAAAVRQTAHWWQWESRLATKRGSCCPKGRRRKRLCLRPRDAHHKASRQKRRSHRLFIFTFILCSRYLSSDDDDRDDHDDLHNTHNEYDDGDEYNDDVVDAQVARAVPKALLRLESTVVCC